MVNYQGVSLLATYAALWKAVHEYDKHVTANNLTIEHYFNQLATFPFQDVVDLFSDYVRKLVRNFLGLMYLPYTQAQSTSIQHLRNSYPIEEEDVKHIRLIRKYSRSLTEDVKQVITSSEIIPNRPLSQHFDTLLKMVYDCPEKYLWIVKPDIETLMGLLERLFVKDNRIETLSKYLKGKFKDLPQLKDFDGQLVEDITNCLLYTHPHPEMYLALENAKKILSLYYTPVDAAKLFIYNVEYKINRYLDSSYYKLDKYLIDWFRNPLNYQKEKELTIEQKYQRFLTVLDQYRSTGFDLKTVLEYGNELRNLPYDQVSELPGFVTNMKYVDQLNRSTTPIDQTELVKLHSNKYMIVRPRVDTTAGSIYESKLESMSKQFNDAISKLSEDVALAKSTDLAAISTKVQEAHDRAQEALVKAESAKNNLSTTNSNLSALVDRVNIADNKLSEVDTTLGTQGSKLNQLDEKTKVLDHLEEVTGFEGEPSFRVIKHHAL